MRFKPEAHDFVVQPDGRVFHVVASRIGFTKGAARCACLAGASSSR